MPSPRVVLSASAQSDVDRILDAAIRAAQQHLAESSEFDPFALVAGLDGRLLAADVDNSGLGRHPESDLIADATTIQLRAIASTIRCAALTVNTRLSELKTDAVEVRIDHREGAGLLVFLPYKRPRFGGAVEYGDLRAYPTVPTIWR
ncbi:hypothetical protein IWX81_000163 [Salinibacterium sp. CAN_S4]|uniref:hypothetical protein n=1 Tax=Salinibacterium sp. CAN_S4 TaxID=2787727 RepID=UPI0018F0313B